MFTGEKVRKLRLTGSFLEFPCAVETCYREGLLRLNLWSMGMTIRNGMTIACGRQPLKVTVSCGCDSGDLQGPRSCLAFQQLASPEFLCKLMEEEKKPR